MDDEPVSFDEALAYMVDLWVHEDPVDPLTRRKLEVVLMDHVFENKAEVAWLVRKRREETRKEKLGPLISQVVRIGEADELGY